MFEFFQNINSMYIASFVVLTVLFYAIILAIIGKVPGLGTESKANRYGKAVSLAISLISTIAIFKVGQTENLGEVVSNVIRPFGIYAGVVLSIFFFAIIYFGLGNKEEGRWHIAVIGIGFSMAIAGYFITKPSVQAVGWLIGVIGLILYISSAGLLTEASEGKK
ncbi:hypothetical protein H6503_06300 [Candidatus Woesearchaeota archaeon]|nr:hypothetical protein [Candidatus Woesearchaeota archaeon]